MADKTISLVKTIITAVILFQFPKSTDEYIDIKQACKIVNN